MRYFLCVVFLTLCIVAWECTANVVGPNVQLEQSEAGRTGETVAPKKDSPGTADQRDGRQVNIEDSAGNDNDDNDNSDQERGDERGDSDGHNVPQERTAGGVDQLQAVVATTPQQQKNEDSDAAITRPKGDDQSSQSGRKSSLGGPNTLNKPVPQTDNTDSSQSREKVDVKTTTTTTAPAPGVQKDVIPLTGEKNTTTAAVQTLSGSPGDKMKNQSTPPKDGDAPDHTMTDAAAAVTTTTIIAPANTLPKQSMIPQSVNNKDSSISTSLLLAFTMLTTLAVIPVASV